MSSFRHSGDLGDIVYMMPVLKAIGGKHIVRLADRTKVPPYSQPIVRRANLLIPLFESQEYVEKIECSEDDVDFDMSKFRVFHRPTSTLSNAQSDYYTSVSGASIGSVGGEPWLEGIEKSTETSGKILVARSPRYYNKHFPWKDIVEHYGSRVMFIGLPVEHMVFQTLFGEVEHLRTDNFLQMAQYIAGCSLFIGNQSSPMSVAMGTGVPIIQETCSEQPDCIFKRDNVQYVFDGGVMLPDISGSGQRVIGSVEVENKFSESCIFEVPPGLWQYSGIPPHTHMDFQCALIAKNEGCSDIEARHRLILHNSARVPDFFTGRTHDQFSTVKIALSNAGLTK